VHQWLFVPAPLCMLNSDPFYMLHAAPLCMLYATPLCVTFVESLCRSMLLLSTCSMLRLSSAICCSTLHVPSYTSQHALLWFTLHVNSPSLSPDTGMIPSRPKFLLSHVRLPPTKVQRTYSLRPCTLTSSPHSTTPALPQPSQAQKPLSLHPCTHMYSQVLLN
jgi:hypothetical protein